MARKTQRREGTKRPERASKPTAPRLESRAEHAYRKLKADLVGGVYGPRQRLIESELSESLGVSRTTLRSVLVRLKEEGLLDLELNRGARVRAFTVEEALESLRIREALECLAVELVIERAGDADLRGLRAVLDEMSEACSRGDPVSYTTLNLRFNSKMLEVTKSPELARLLTSLSYSLARFQFRTILVGGRMEQSLAEHREVLKHLQARNVDQAAAAVRAHLNNVRLALQQATELPRGVGIEMARNLALRAEPAIAR